jgi:ABC-type Na+ transport system ATPase subunit NatA
VMSEVEKLCDFVDIIHRGRLLAGGTPAELKARHGVPDLEEVFVREVTSAGGAEEAA